MDNVTSKPLVNGFPPTLKLASKTEKRQWLHEHVSKMLNKYVMGSFGDLLSIHESLASQITALQAENICHHAGCNKKFTYTVEYFPVHDCGRRLDKKTHGIVQRFI